MIAGAFALLTNRYVAIALAIAAALFAFHEWDVARIDAKNARAAAAAIEARRKDIASYVVDASVRDGKAREALKQKENELDQAKAQLDAQRGKNVTPKNIAAVGFLPFGIIVQHNADATGRAAVANQYAGSIEKPSGVGIDTYSGTVGRNYAGARKQDARFESLENKLIAECEAWNKKWRQNNFCGSGGADKKESEGVSKAGK